LQTCNGGARLRKGVGYCEDRDRAWSAAALHPTARIGFMNSTSPWSRSLSVTTKQPFATAIEAMIMSRGLRGRPAAFPSAISFAEINPAFSEGLSDEPKVASRNRERCARAKRYQNRQLELKAAPTKVDDFRIAGRFYGRCTRGLADRGAATAPCGALVAL
jgi:hypothetical protein